MKLVVCNLKNRLDKKSNITHSNMLKEMDYNGYRMIVAPSMPFMNYYVDRKFYLASQDISSFDNKIITGEITGEQLASIGCKYVIVGHSERRLYNKEININFINKINNAQENGMEVIYCIGELLEDRNNNEQYNVLEQQISEVLNNVDTKNIIIAYEPMYTIGGNYTLSKEDIEDTIQYIKDITFEKYETIFKVLYGGGINTEVIKRIIDLENIDGYLIGSSSTDIDELRVILNVINSNK